MCTYFHKDSFVMNRLPSPSKEALEDFETILTFRKKVFEFLFFLRILSCSCCLSAVFHENPSSSLSSELRFSELEPVLAFLVLGLAISPDIRLALFVITLPNLRVADLFLLIFTIGSIVCLVFCGLRDCFYRFLQLLLGPHYTHHIMICFTHAG